MKLSTRAIGLAMSLGSVAAQAAQVDDTVTPVHILPAVNDLVMVKHQSAQNAAGFSAIVDAAGSQERVVQVLEGNYPYKRVKVASGDVWDVTLAGSDGKGAKWITKRVRYHVA